MHQERNKLIYKMNSPRRHFHLTKLFIAPLYFLLTLPNPHVRAPLEYCAANDIFKEIFEVRHPFFTIYLIVSLESLT